MLSNPIMSSRLTSTLISLLIVTLIGCSAHQPLDHSPKSDTTDSTLNFVDINKFDKDLAASLTSSHNEVTVLFYTKVSPNKLPERIQQWISAAESSGGKVRVEHPPNEPSPRTILPLLSLLGTVYSALKDHLTPQPEIYTNAAKGRSVIIALERGSTGDLLVEKIQFIK